LKKSSSFLSSFCFILCLTNLSFIFGQDNGVNELIQKSEFLAPAEIGVNEYKPIEDPVLKRRESKNVTAIPSQNNQKIQNSTSSNSKFESELENIMNEVHEKIENNVDNNEYSKIESFDAENLNFERFKNSSCYDKIGFNPSWDMDGLENEYQNCESEHSFQILKIVIYVIIFLAIIGVIIYFSVPKNQNDKVEK
jgi:hypothetical protein